VSSGIFRKSANFTKCREAKTRLDCGRDYDFSDILVTASLFKVGVIHYMLHVLDRDIMLHPASLQVQLGSIDLMVEMPISRWWWGLSPFTRRKFSYNISQAHWESAVALSFHRQKC